MQTNKWIKIRPGGKMPKQGEPVDIWVPDYGRLTDYRLQLNYAGKIDNNFF